MLREQDKHFLWSLYAAIAVIFTWKGLWEGLYKLPYIGDPFIFLSIGLFMLTLSGVIFKEFDPLGGVEKTVNKILHFVYNHPGRRDFSIMYKDKAGKKDVVVNADRLRGFEKGALVMEHERRKEEFFLPVHRVTEILYKGKTYWRL